MDRYRFAQVELSELVIVRDDAHLLGRGGFGTVWRGQWGTRAVAIKEMPYDKHDLADLSVLRCGSHENILPVLGWSCDRDANRFYVVLPLVQPGSLGGVMTELKKREDAWSLATGGPLGWPRLLKVLLGLARALHHLATRKLTHRDVKPDNLLIDVGDDVVLADFGLAVLATQSSFCRVAEPKEQPEEKKVCGTLAYLAPEALNGQPANPKMDIYALGVVAWALYTGGVPREGIAPSLFHIVIMADVPLRLPTETPEWLKRLIEACTAFDPQERPTAHDVVQQLTPHAALHPHVPVGPHFAVPPPAPPTAAEHQQLPVEMASLTVNYQDQHLQSERRTEKQQLQLANHRLQGGKQQRELVRRRRPDVSVGRLLTLPHRASHKLQMDQPDEQQPEVANHRLQGEKKLQRELVRRRRPDVSVGRLLPLPHRASHNLQMDQSDEQQPEVANHRLQGEKKQLQQRGSDLETRLVRTLQGECHMHVWNARSDQHMITCKHRKRQMDDATSCLLHTSGILLMCKNSEEDDGTSPSITAWCNDDPGEGGVSWDALQLPTQHVEASELPTSGATTTQSASSQAPVPQALCDVIDSVGQDNVRSVVRVMKELRDDVEVQQSGCAVLSDLACDAHNRPRVWVHGGVTAVLRAMKKNETSKEIVTSGCTVLNHAAREQGVIRPMVDTHSLTSVLRMLRNRWKGLFDAKLGEVLRFGCDTTDDPKQVLPKNMKCPLTGRLFDDPVKCSDGDTYERAAIAQWLSQYHTSPHTEERLADESLHPDADMRDRKERYLKDVLKLVDPTTLRIGQRIGKDEGAFKCVYKGWWQEGRNQERQVAVLVGMQKCEALVHARLSASHHEHLVEYLGWCPNHPKYGACMITEYASMGSLRSLLHRESESGRALSMSHKRIILEQITSCMMGLTEKCSRHRDLAVRNVLVFCYDPEDAAHTCMKVCDFGLSQLHGTGSTTVAEGIKGEMLPLLHTAPEIYQTGVSTEKSEVFAFGVSAYEVLTDGHRPPHFFEWEEGSARSVPRSKQCPAGCPSALWKVLEQCFKLNPKNRPSFKKLHDALSTQQMKETCAGVAAVVEWDLRLPSEHVTLNEVVGVLQSEEHATNATLMAHGCAALVRTTTSMDERSDVGERGIMDSVVTAMRLHTDIFEVQRYGCHALRHIGTGSPHLTRLATSHVMEAIVMAMIRHTERSELQIEACGLLATVCATSEGVTAFLTACGGDYFPSVSHTRLSLIVECIVTVMKTTTTVHRSSECYGCTVLGYLAAVGTDVRCVLVEGGAVAAITRVMTQFIDNVNVQITGCLALSALASEQFSDTTSSMADRAQLITCAKEAAHAAKTEHSSKDNEAVIQVANCTLGKLNAHPTHATSTSTAH